MQPQLRYLVVWRHLAIFSWHFHTVLLYLSPTTKRFRYTMQSKLLIYIEKKKKKILILCIYGIYFVMLSAAMQVGVHMRVLYSIRNFWSWMWVLPTVIIYTHQLYLRMYSMMQFHHITMSFLKKMRSIIFVTVALWLCWWRHTSRSNALWLTERGTGTFGAWLFSVTATP